MKKLLLTALLTVTPALLLADYKGVEHYNELENLTKITKDALAVLDKPFVDIKNMQQIARRLRNVKSNILVLQGYEPNSMLEIEVFNPKTGEQAGTLNVDKLINAIEAYKLREDKEALKELINEARQLAALRQFELLEGNAYLKNSIGFDLFQNAWDQAQRLDKSVMNNTVRSIEELNSKIEQIKSQLKKADLLSPSEGEYGISIEQQNSALNNYLDGVKHQFLYHFYPKNAAPIAGLEKHKELK